MRKIFLLLILVTAFSCRSRKVFSDRAKIDSVSHTKDNTLITTTERIENTVFVPQESTKVTVPLVELSDVPMIFPTDNGTLGLSVSNGVLVAKLNRQATQLKQIIDRKIVEQKKIINKAAVKKLNDKKITEPAKPAFPYWALALLAGISIMCIFVKYIRK